MRRIQPRLDTFMKDEVVEQVRQVREQQAAKLNFDLKAILARPSQDCLSLSHLQLAAQV